MILAKTTSAVNIKSILLMCMLFLFIRSKGQDKTQYLIYEIPQTIQLNPAISYECKNFIELPLISQVQYFFRNSAFSYKQVLKSTSLDDKDSLFVDAERLGRVAGNYNNIRLGGGLTLAGAGFRFNDIYVTLNVSNRTSGRFSFSRDILDALDGNWDLSANSPKDIRIKGTALNFISYTEFAVGLSKELNSKLSAGIRAKYLMGAAHLQTVRSGIDLQTSENPIVLTGTTDFLVRGSMPVNVITGSDGYVDDIENQITSVNDLPSLLISPNHGFAIDAGILYEYSDEIRLSASILDLGFIHWKRNVTAITQDEDFIFQGLDLNNFINSGGDTDFLQALEDSINSVFQPTATSGSYTAPVPVRLLAGADYSLNKSVNFGVVTEAEILSGRFFPSLTLTAIYRPNKFITASAAYSLMDRGYSNLGFSVVLGNGPLQFYFVSDKLPLNYVHERELGLFWPYAARTMNFRTGINIILDCYDKQKRYRKMKWKKSCPAYN